MISPPGRRLVVATLLQAALLSPVPSMTITSNPTLFWMRKIFCSTSRVASMSSQFEASCGLSKEYHNGSVSTEITFFARDDQNRVE